MTLPQTTFPPYNIGANKLLVPDFSLAVTATPEEGHNESMPFYLHQHTELTPLKHTPISSTKSRGDIHESTGMSGGWSITSEKADDTGSEPPAYKLSDLWTRSFLIPNVTILPCDEFLLCLPNPDLMTWWVRAYSDIDSSSHGWCLTVASQKLPFILNSSLLQKTWPCSRILLASSYWGLPDLYKTFLPTHRYL